MSRLKGHSLISPVKELHDCQRVNAPYALVSGDSSQEKLGGGLEKIGGLGAKPVGKFQRPRPLDLREKPFFIIEIGPF